MVLIFMILFVIFSNAVLGQYNDKDVNKKSDGLIQTYNSASPSKYGGESFREIKRNGDYVMLLPIKALTTQPAHYAEETKHSQFLFVPNDDQNPNPGPQMFNPPQIARISEFHAPDQYKFIPPEQQPYRPRDIDHQQPPVLFVQPEFAVIEPIVPIRPQYPHYLREILKQQGYVIVEQEEVPRLELEKEDSEEGIDDNQLPPITKNNFNNFGRNSRFDSGDVELVYDSNKLAPKSVLKGFTKHPIHGIRRLR